MSLSAESITTWLCRLKEGDRAHVSQLWENYYPRLVALAREKLRGMPRRLADEEDVALSAFDSFCRAAESGRFPKLDDREDLWQVLVMLTIRKTVDLFDYETRAKRDYRREQAQADLAGGRANSGVSMFAQLIQSPEPDPQFAVELAEQLEHLLRKLPDDEARQIALMKMEGFTNREIADRINRSIVTVERRLQRIRHLWEDV